MCLADPCGSVRIDLSERRSVARFVILLPGNGGHQTQRGDSGDVRDVRFPYVHISEQ